ncbi:MAG: hypothetical protein EA397_00435 [Deltaproteobacteria bacterium]|nr:MAG: hypothetical protein EA397_00435 [Deltaproteobacteria bacterium]
MQSSLPTASLPTHRVQPTALDPEERLFRHKSKPEWGIGVWMEEESNKRRLRFEDGQFRAFKKGFYHLLKPVDTEKVDVQEVFGRIVGEHVEAVELKATDKPPVMPFAAQIAVFRHLYPEGFDSEAFDQTWRRPESGSVRKAHLHAAMDKAAFLKKKASRKRIEAGEAAQLADEAIKLLGSTTLITPAKLKPLKNLDEEGRAVLGTALVELLHGEARFGKRFKAWLTTLNELHVPPSWRTATGWLGLAKPTKHMPIRRRVLLLQARAISPVQVPATPSLAGYRRARRVAKSTHNALEKAGLQPENLLDVYAFIWETLRPKGQKLAKEIGQ